MVGVIVLFVVQVFLFGLTKAQCNTTCSGCKNISDPQYIGTWNLVDPLSSICPSNVSCLYRSNDGQEMCFCDPGNITYEICPTFDCGLCYDYTEVVWFPTNFTDNDVPTCDSHCQNLGYTFYILGSTNLDDGILCGCSSTQPNSSLVVGGDNCDQPCPGNQDQICGGYDNYNNKRYVNICQTYPDPPPTDGDCYNNTLPTCHKLLNNDVQTCNNYSQTNWGNSTYFCLGSSSSDDGFECCDGGSIAPPASKKVHPSYCSVPCPGNNDETCGAYSWYNQTYVNCWERRDE